MFPSGDPSPSLSPLNHLKSLLHSLTNLVCLENEEGSKRTEMSETEVPGGLTKIYLSTSIWKTQLADMWGSETEEDVEGLSLLHGDTS